MNKSAFIRQLFCIVLIAHGVKAAELTVADFEDDVSDFSGAIVHDSTAPQAGVGAGRIDADFSAAGEPWVTAVKAVDVKNKLKSISFWAKSSDFSGLTLRFVDSTGQNHQQRPDLAADGQWHQIVINSFDNGPGYEKFGGANDGQFHWPMTSISVIAEKGKLDNKTKGSVWIDQVSADVVGDLPKAAPTTKLVFGDFKTDIDGFAGAMEHADGEGKTGKGFATVAADFSKPGDPWLTAAKDIAFTNEIQSASLWVKSSDSNGLTFRLIDATGQVHQQRPSFAADGQWHRITIRSFDHGPYYERFNGANDGKFHWPATQLGLVFEKNSLGGRAQGTWSIDDIELNLVGPLRGAMDDLKSVPLAEFDTGSDGFGDALTHVDGGHTGGAGRLFADFSKPGDAWVTASRELTLKNELKSLRFWVKSSDVSGLTVRLTDSTGQNHQQRPTFPADGQWHQITLAKLTGGPGYERFGGAADGQFHPPAIGLCFILEKGALNGKLAGSILIDDVEAIVDTNAIVPKAELEQKVLANVFLTTETPEIRLHTQADQVSWTVIDFWNNQIAAGRTPVVDHYAVIQPGKELRGYFLLKMNAQKGGQELADVQTTFCVIPPIDLESVRGSHFGVMTHFAQGWDTDIMALIVKAGISTIRDELYWEQVEKKPGDYVFTPQFEKYMTAAKKIGIDPLIVMSFANPLYDHGDTPWTPEGCEAYARYGQAILNHYGKQIKWLEVWNEYNGSWCTGPAATDRSRYYAQMLKHVYDRVKQVRPDVQVLGGAAVLQPLPYFQGIFDNGGLASMDAAVIHPYRGNPEGVEQDVNDLQELAKKYVASGKPIWATETGCIDQSPTGRERIARYLARQYTLLLSANVEKIYWYLCRDYNEFKSMGLLHDPQDPMGRYVPAPAYVAYATLIRQLNAATFVAREKTSAHTYVERFSRNGSPIRVCWATVPENIAFSADKPLTLVDLMGVERTLTPVNGQVYLTLTDAAVYLKGDASLIDAPRLTLAADQAVDLTGELHLHFSYDNHGSTEPMSATFSVGSEAHPFQVKAGEKYDGDIAVAGVRTSQIASMTCWYNLTANGALLGTGGVQVRVVDPVQFSGQLAASAGNRVGVTLRNTSLRTTYAIEGFDWSVGGDRHQARQSLSLPPGKQVAFNLPVQQLKPFAEAASNVAVNMTGRDPAVQSGSLSYNPLALRQITIDGDLGDWNDVASINGDDKTFVAYDQNNFYVAGHGSPSALRIGIAASDARRDPGNPRDAWFELKVDAGVVTAMLAPGLQKPAALQGAQIKTGAGDAYEIAISWSSLGSIRPSNAELRLAIANEANAVFGQGILYGKTPMLYRICHFEGSAAASADHQPAGGQPAASIEAIAQMAAAPQGGKVIGDSVQDYSNTQGRNGWSYGYYGRDGQGSGDGALPSGPYTDDDFKPMKYVATMWGYEWSEPTVPFLQLTPTGGHPGAAGGQPVWGVRRWTSPIDGDIRVTGEAFCFDNQGDGIDGKVLVDGIVVWTGVSRSADRPEKDKPEIAACDVIVHVKKGSHVDFALTPGPVANNQYDAANFTCQIQQIGK